MGLVELQKVLAKLYTDTELREHFFSNPQFGETLGLTPLEVQQLSELSVSQVNLFASSLKRKRLGEVKELLPLTQRVLGKDFSKEFWCYSETYNPSGIKKHYQDALAFAKFLEQQKLEPVWIRDLIRYEKAWLEAMEPRCRSLMYRFDYDMKSLIQSLQRREDPVIREKRAIAFVAVWFRLPSGKIRQIIV